MLSFLVTAPCDRHRNIGWDQRWPIPFSAGVEFLGQYEKILLQLLCLLLCLLPLRSFLVALVQRVLGVLALLRCNHTDWQTIEIEAGLGLRERLQVPLCVFAGVARHCACPIFTGMSSPAWAVASNVNANAHCPVSP